MSSPELEDESIRIIGSREPSWRTAIKVAAVLLVHVTAISRANSPPAIRENPDPPKGINRIVVEGIGRLAAYVHRSARFADKLKVAVRNKLESQSRQQLVRTVQQNRVVHC